LLITVLTFLSGSRPVSSFQSKTDRTIVPAPPARHLRDLAGRRRSRIVFSARSWFRGGRRWSTTGVFDRVFGVLDGVRLWNTTNLRPGSLRQPISKYLQWHSALFLPLKI
jgi:hypothetical protein